MKKTKDQSPYPHKFQISHTIPKLIETFAEKCEEIGKFLDVEVAIAGRILSIRNSGKNLIFVDLLAESKKVQIFVNKKLFSDATSFENVKNFIKRGDIIGVNGKIG